MKLDLAQASRTGVRIVNNLDAPGGSSDFQQELLALWQDPQVRSFVRKLAGDCDLIEDLWQAALCAAGTVKHPEHIDDRRAYFITVLKHEAYRLYALSRAIPMENPDQHGALVCGQASARPVADTACTSVQAESWLDRLHAQRVCLEAAVPARSDDPAFYRAVIYTSAEGVLRDGINGRAQRRRLERRLPRRLPRVLRSAGRLGEPASPALPPGPRGREGAAAGRRPA